MAVVSHSPRWYYIPVRVILITFLLSLMAFALSLLVGIAGTFVAGLIRGVHPNMTLAYRHVAIPVATTIAVIVLIGVTINELRRYRQSKALQGIEAASR